MAAANVTSSSYRVKFKRDEFLELVEIAKLGDHLSTWEDAFLCL